jgi:hypothetical protein
MALQDRLPLKARALAGMGAQAQPDNGHGRRRIGRPRGRLPMRHRPVIATGGLGELHDDAERLLRVKEGFLPLRVCVVAAHDVVARALGAGGDLVEARHLERDVVDARAALVEETVEEAVVSHGLEDLDGPTALERPRPKTEDVGRLTIGGDAAQCAHEHLGRIHHPGHADCDVIEADPGHGPSCYPTAQGRGSKGDDVSETMYQTGRVDPGASCRYP